MFVLTSERHNQASSKECHLLPPGSSSSEQVPVYNLKRSSGIASASRNFFGYILVCYEQNSLDPETEIMHHA